MDAHEYANLEQRLRSRGWTKDAAGTWTAPGKDGGGGVGAVPAAKSERSPAPALDRCGSELKGGADGVGYCISLVAFRRRLLDDDNNVGSMKPIRDAVAGTLGLDDGDACVKFECFQVRTDGEQGVLVKVELSGEDVKRSQKDVKIY